MKKTIQTTKLFYRKYTHRVAFYGKKAGVFIGKHAARGFFYLFPKAGHAFRKHDHLAGLKHGPSSFFLHKISEHKKVAKKRTRVLE